MANKQYTEKSNPFLTFLYIVVVLVLIAALVFMYTIYREKKNSYATLVEQASKTDEGYDIEARKADDDTIIDLEDQAVETTMTLAPTATVAPTAVPTATAMPELTEAPAAEPEPTVTAFIPEPEKNELLDESLAKGIAAN